MLRDERVFVDIIKIVRLFVQLCDLIDCLLSIEIHGFAKLMNNCCSDRFGT